MILSKEKCEVTCSLPQSYWMSLVSGVCTWNLSGVVQVEKEYGTSTYLQSLISTTFVFTMEQTLNEVKR